MSEITGYMVYFESGDSHFSVPQLPKAVFMDEEKAIEFAKAQEGYGYGKDWFVKPIPILG
jgi:hypothetical protein